MRWFAKGERAASQAVVRALDALGWEGDARCALSFAERLRGCMGLGSAGAGAPAGPLVFPRCRALHTCFMRVPLDIAFADENGEILRYEKGVAPGRFLWCSRADFALERSAAEGPADCRAAPDSGA